MSDEQLDNLQQFIVLTVAQSEIRLRAEIGRLETKVDQGFRKADEKFRQIDEGFRRMNEGFRKMDEGFAGVGEALSAMNDDNDKRFKEQAAKLISLRRRPA